MIEAYSVSSVRAAETAAMGELPPGTLMDRAARGLADGDDVGIGNMKPRTVTALDDILHGCSRSGDNVNSGFESHPGHSQRIFDTVLIVDNVILRQNMDYLLVGWNRHRFGCVQHPVQVSLTDLSGLDRDNAVAVEGFDVTSSDPGKNGINFTPGH